LTHRRRSGRIGIGTGPPSPKIKNEIGGDSEFDYPRQGFNSRTLGGEPSEEFRIG